MKVRALADCFIGGSRRKKGTVFDVAESEVTGPIEKLEDDKPVQPVKTPDDTGPTKNDIIAQLEAAGVKFNVNDNKATLKALLDEAVKVAAPASSGAPDKSLT